MSQLKKRVLVIIMIAIILLGANYGFLELKSNFITNYQKYPPSTDCLSINDMFDNKYDQSYLDAAIKDKENTMNSQGAGIY
jgi:hypothetical protein